MKRLALALALLAVVVLTAALGCGKSKVSAPKVGPPPAEQLPPSVSAVYPLPRSVRVLVSTPIWAEFVAPLDPATVNDKNVYLKVDTQRVPIAISLEGGGLRIRITPLVVLKLQTTYTVEFSPNLATAEGVPLGQQYFWQFTTLSVRASTNPVPSNGTVGESPFVALGWAGNADAPGGASYDIYAGEDSARVRQRLIPPVAHVGTPFFLPKTRWSNTRHYWSITAINNSTSETADGPMWTFSTPPAGPIDSVLMVREGWGYFLQGSPSYRQYCNLDTVISGAPYTCAIHWTVVGMLPTTTKLYDARIELTVTPASAWAIPEGSSLWSIRAAFTDCRYSWPGPPFADQRLATSVEIAPRRLRYASDTLTAHIEAMVRRPGYYGYWISSTPNISYVTDTSRFPPEDAPLMMIYYYVNSTSGPGATSRKPAGAR